MDVNGHFWPKACVGPAEDQLWPNLDALDPWRLSSPGQLANLKQWLRVRAGQSRFFFEEKLENAGHFEPTTFWAAGRGSKCRAEYPALFLQNFKADIRDARVARQ